jgi:phosphopantothenoylcysteine synthetase/decarboxylase
VTRSDAGFDAVTNAITIISRDRSDAVSLPLMSKLDCAHRILDEIVRLRRQGREELVANSGSA